MKKIYCLAIAALTLLLSGCQADVDNDAKIGNRIAPTFTSSFENVGTRTYVDNDLYMYWTADDRLSIFTSTYNEQYRFDGQTGATGGSFSKVNTGQFVSGNAISTNYGVYPYNASTSLTKDEKILLELPATQAYAENTFGVGANTMVAVTNGTSDTFLPFKNVCGYLVVKLYGEGKVTKVIFEGNNGEKIAGAATVVASHNADPVVTMSNDATTSITIDCGDGVELGKTADAATEFWFVIPPTTFSNGFTIKAISYGVMQITKSTTASRTIQRNVVNSMPALETDFTMPVDSKAIIMSGPSFNAILKNIALNTEGLDHLARDENNLTRIVFNTSSTNTEGIQIQDPSSEIPIYLVYDRSSGVATISTLAETIMLPEDASYMFAYFGSLSSIDNMNCLNTENVVNMGNMFCYVNMTNRELRHIDLSSFKTPNVISTRSMFNGCRHIESLDLSNFDFSQDTSMAYMFQYCINLTDLNLGENFNSGNVMNMQGMFRDCNSLPSLDLSKFNTENVERMDYMLYGLESVETLDCSSFNTESVERMDYMFGYCLKLVSLNVKSFNTENCTIFNHMFLHCESLPTVDLSSFNTENALKLNNFFWHCYSLASIDVSNFSFASATDARSFFNRCYALESVDLSMIDGKDSGLTTSASIGYFFYGAKSLHELNFGELFMFNVKPQTPFCEKGSEYDLRCGSAYGAITIYCDQDVCNYWATTGLRWLEYGYNNAGLDTPPIHTTFKHYKTGVELLPAEFPPCLHVTSIGLSITSITVSEGDYFLLTATVLPDNADDKTLKWTSSDSSIAWVSEYSGMVTAISKGTAIITATANDGSGQSASCSVKVTALPEEAVDLGLSVKWASCNVGASKPEEYGNYYAWGETSMKTNYSWSTYKWCKGSYITMTKYCSNSSYGYNGFTDTLTVLEANDDVAHVTWGGSWRMPTDAEFTELRTQCTWTWTALNGVNGRLVTGPNGNSIFLPAAGLFNLSTLCNEGFGYYWSSSLDTDFLDNGFYVDFGSDYVRRYNDYRYFGLSVRPVCD